MYVLNEPVLLIGSSSSDCGMCGKGADPYAKRHLKTMGYGPQGPGCGVEWVMVSTTYHAPGIKEAIKAMRPDLTLVSLVDILPSA